MVANYPDVLSRLLELGVALTGESDSNVLLTKVLEAAVDLTNAQGGTIYTVDESDNTLLFFVALNRALGIRVGGSYEKAFNADGMRKLELYDKVTKGKNFKSVSSYAYHMREVVNIEDVYNGDHNFDISGVRGFDDHYHYKTDSIMSVPVISRDNRVTCVLQMINRMDDDGNVIPFHSSDGKHESLEFLLKAIASQAGIAIENNNLIKGERELWDSLLKMMASLIDKKSAYTGGHCLRVPILTEMIAKAANESTDEFADFYMTDGELYELNVAAWLHDIGKVTTPEYVVDKSVKLETIYNRFHEVRMRFELLARDAEIAYLKALNAGKDRATALKKKKKTLADLQEDFAFLASCNKGGEFIDTAQLKRIDKIAKRKWMRHFDKSKGLSDEEEERVLQSNDYAPGCYEYLLADSPEDKIAVLINNEKQYYNLGEIYNLSVSRGTLNFEERKKIEEHVKVTIDVLEELPLPNHLRNVVEYAGGHHERMDGKGYPKGLKREQLSVPARMMAIADVFEALTSSDRPYRSKKTLSQSLSILSSMAQHGHIDPSLHRLFVKSGIWYTYACEHLQKDQIDIDDTNLYIKEALSA